MTPFQTHFICVGALIERPLNTPVPALHDHPYTILHMGRVKSETTSPLSTLRFILLPDKANLRHFAAEKEAYAGILETTIQSAFP